MDLQETNLYYLQSRYYDPEVGRFLNADIFIATGQGMLGNNMFTYCLNSPICRIDSEGYISYTQTEDSNENNNPLDDVARIGSGTTKNAHSSTGKGFSTFKALKKFLGSPGKNNQWHHIVEQCQTNSSRSGFNVSSVQNTGNVVSISSGIHSSISSFYSSIPDINLVNTGGMVFRNWLNGMSFEQQFQWGLWVLSLFGVNI